MDDRSIKALKDQGYTLMQIDGIIAEMNRINTEQKDVDDSIEKGYVSMEDISVKANSGSPVPSTTKNSTPSPVQSEGGGPANTEVVNI